MATMTRSPAKRGRIVPLQDENIDMPFKSSKLTRSLSRPLTNLTNNLRIIHPERGISSEHAKKVDAEQRKSGGISSATVGLDRQSSSSPPPPILRKHHSSAPTHPTNLPRAVKRKPVPSIASDRAPSPAAGLSAAPSSRTKHQSLPVPAPPSSQHRTRSTSPTLSEETPLELHHASQAEHSPSTLLKRSASSSRGPRVDGPITPERSSGSRKGKERASAPAVVETCPTPPTTTRYRPSSRQRSLLNSSGLGIEVDNIAYGNEDNYLDDLDRFSVGSYRSNKGADLDTDDDDEDHDPNEFDPYARRPSTPFTPPFHPNDSGALPFPDSDVYSIVHSAIPSCVDLPARLRTPEPTRLEYLRPTRRWSEVPFVPFQTAEQHLEGLRAMCSETSLSEWDAAHLPAPGTPREAPYKVRWADLIIPTYYLRGGRLSGKYGDPTGPIERKVRPSTPQPLSTVFEPRPVTPTVEQPSTSGTTLREKIARRKSSIRASLSLSGTSRRDRLSKGSSRTKEELDTWVVVAWSDEVEPGRRHGSSDEFGRL